MEGRAGEKPLGGCFSRFIIPEKENYVLGTKTPALY